MTSLCVSIELFDDGCFIVHLLSVEVPPACRVGGTSVLCYSFLYEALDDGFLRGSSKPVVPVRLWAGAPRGNNGR